MNKLIFTMLSSSLLYGEILEKIEIKGNKRIESETIKSYLSVNIGDEFDEMSVDQSFKKLFSSGYFSDVKAQKVGTTFKITVEENPTINKIAFEGNSALKDDQIAKDIPLKSRKILSLPEVQNAQQRLLEIYRRMGYFSAKVEPKTIKLDQNRVNLVFEIFEGPIATIDKVIFVGNNKFSSTELEEAILSKRAKWWRFFATDDRYDPDRLMADQQALRQLYGNKGYPEFRIVSASSELSNDRKNFYLTFVMDEGDRYTFSDISINTAIKGIDIERLKKEITFSKGDMYSAKELDKTVTAISEVLGEKGYAFVVIEPIVNKDNKNKTATITFSIKEGPRIYIDRINIGGNSRTHDDVIRRELSIHEGDIFNTLKLRQSETNLKNLDYFKNVSVDPEQADNPDRANLNVKVEEQSTGSVRFSTGYSTVDGIVFNVGYSERNFMGKGQTIHGDATLGKKVQDFTVGIIEPYLFNKRLVGTIDVFSNKNSRIDSFTTQTVGFSTGIGYNLTTNLIQKWSYSLHSDKTSSIDKTTSVFLQNEPRKAVSSSVAHTLKYDKRDSIIDPTKGYVLSMTNTFAGVGGSVSYLRNDFSSTVFYTPVEQMLIFARLDFGRVHKIGKRKLRIVDGVYLGGDSFKGFEYGGVGPCDSLSANKDIIGGQKYWTTTLESQFSMGLPVDLGIRGAAFTQLGSVWDAPVKNNVLGGNLIDNRKTRVSVGFGIIWKGPLGPLRIDYAVPVVRSKLDATQRINLSYHTPI
jgi:outer membrane protein insertion porin family